MGKYRRMTLAVRCQIDALLQAGFCISEISDKIGFHKTSIYREIKRNTGFGSYMPGKAQLLAESRYKSCRKPYKINDDVSDKLKVYLEWGWSPDQISQRLKKEKALSLSHECIYQFIHKNPKLKKYLRRPRRKGFSRYSKTSCRAKNSLPISERPNIAERRGRIGDWERDLFYAANRQQALVCTDRKSRYTKISKLEAVDSGSVGSKTEQLIRGLGKQVYTVSNDNGPEFRGKPLNIKTFHCEPRKPQQRGTVENTIGLIRQYINRKTDIKQMTEEQITEIERKLNFRPRKCLDYKTPHEVFFKCKVALAI